MTFWTSNSILYSFISFIKERLGIDSLELDNIIGLVIKLVIRAEVDNKGLIVELVIRITIKEEVDNKGLIVKLVVRITIKKDIDNKELIIG